MSSLSVFIQILVYFVILFSVLQHSTNCIKSCCDNIKVTLGVEATLEQGNTSGLYQLVNAHPVLYKKERSNLKIYYDNQTYDYKGRWVVTNLYANLQTAKQDPNMECPSKAKEWQMFKQSTNLWVTNTYISLICVQETSNCMTTDKTPTELTSNPTKAAQKLH